jgi:uncharacterized membrane-anchored protein YhcB (DUF1043 family)
VIYDVYGKKTNPDGIRTKFNTHEVAHSYVKEYQQLFPHLDFSIQSVFPEIERKTIFSRVMKKDHR